MAISALFKMKSPLLGAARTNVVQDDALLQLAHSTIGLSLIAPRICELAASRKADAERQAAHVGSIANMVREMTTTLNQTMQQLHLSASEIGDLTALIQRIADETRIIAMNAGIVAAHAGEQGRAFTVLAKQIHALSENTAIATKDVQGKVERLEENTLRTALAVGLDKNRHLSHANQSHINLNQINQNQQNNHHKNNSLHHQKPNSFGLTWLLNSMDESQTVATHQANEAHELNDLGEDLNALSEQMIHAIGLFRLNIHEHIEQLIEVLRIDRELTSADPRWQITALRQMVKSHPFIELAYVTDARGIQTTDNVSNHQFDAAYGNSGKHQDWSKRAWFIDAKHSDDVYLSDIYRSQATNEFCLTASATFDDWHGNFAGVVAIDVNFRR